MAPNTLVFVDSPSDDVGACAAFYGKVFNGAFRDPWGTEVVVWTKGGENTVIPEGHTSE